jgi:hypothetical protein
MALVIAALIGISSALADGASAPTRPIRTVYH